MPKITVNSDGSVSAKRTQTETINYYNNQIKQRSDAMFKLMILGEDTSSIQTRIIQLNAEKKQKILEVQ